MSLLPTDSLGANPAEPARAHSLLDVELRKWDGDFRFLLGCFQTVLGRIGEGQLGIFLGDVFSDAPQITNELPPRASQARASKKPVPPDRPEQTVSNRRPSPLRRPKGSRGPLTVRTFPTRRPVPTSQTRRSR